MDQRTQHEVVDFIRRSDVASAVTLFGRLVKLAYNQGQIDAFFDTMQRVGSIEAQIEYETSVLADRRIEQ